MFEFWYDVETTGLDPIKSGIIQLSGLLIKEDKIIAEFNEYINPLTYNKEIIVDQVALEINHLTNYKEFQSAKIVLAKFMDFFVKNCPRDKVKLFGYNNSTFDKYFLEELFYDQGKDFCTYFHYKQIDIFELVKSLQYMKLMPKSFNQKLGTIGELLGIEFKGNLHDSLTDSYLTRDVYKIIEENLLWK